MPTGISNYDLAQKCKRFILADPTSQAIDDLIQDALITSEREIRDVDKMGGPLAWLREQYDELFTNPYASISAITQADPGVFSADSSDSDITGHGFSDDDLIFISGVGDMERLNERFLRLDAVDTLTFSLYQLHDQLAIDTTDYEEYASGGTIYHVGIILPATTIEPTSVLETEESYRWKIGKIFDVTFDGYPTDPMSERSALGDRRWWESSGRPTKFRHLQYNYSDPARSGTEHFLLWNGLAGQRYNIGIHFEKDYPDLSNFVENDTPIYPPHPPEIHDFIWHRALANLITNAERQRRTTKDGGDNTKIEYLYADYWLNKRKEDEGRIITLNRKMIGAFGSGSMRA